MLLIANFNATLGQDEIIVVAAQIAAQLEEEVTETVVVSVIPTLVEVGQAGYAPLTAAPVNLAAIKRGQANLPSTVLPYSVTSNYNRVGESLLGAVGLADSDDGWQDAGAVVIIPPSDPALTLFLGHALVHYLTEGEVWSPLYVVVHPVPLVLNEWD